jgi:hypothetical protein
MIAGQSPPDALGARNLGVRVGVVHDADRPARADNGRVASYAMLIDIDLRIDGDWITRILRSA